MDEQKLVQVSHLKKYFRLKETHGFGKKPSYVHAVDDVSFDIRRGQIFGIIGESGSGKSTIGRCILRLTDIDEGQILFDGEDISHYDSRQMQKVRSKMQMVFQNPLASFNPKKKIRFALEEPAIINGIKKEEYGPRVDRLTDYISLQRDVLDRYPSSLSGGQLQRLAIARALMLNPEFLLADEPVSALDVSVQAQILNLFLDLKEDYHLTILFISHDLNVVRSVCDEVAIVYLGKIMEMGPINEVYAHVMHPYTQALIDAKPREHPLEQKEGDIIEGEIQSAVDIAPGCRFASRCVRCKKGLCDVKSPELKEYGNGHYVACHFPQIPADDKQ